MSSHENLITIFQYALQQEETGKSFFQSSLRTMGVGAAISAFKRLIQEEELHIRFIKKIVEGLKQGNLTELSVEKGLTLEPTHYFDERSKSEFLQQCLEGSMVPEVTVFNTAWLIEKDSADFTRRCQERQKENPEKHSKCSPSGKKSMNGSLGSFATNSLKFILKCPGEVNWV